MLTDREKDLTAGLAAVLCTIADTDAGLGVPLGPMYAAMMNSCGLSLFNRLVDGLEHSGFITRGTASRNLVFISDKGRDAARQLEAALSAK
jgi:hypothetical protein